MNDFANVPESSQPPVGIDLGTTLSALAYVDSTGRPVTVPNQLGDMLTPSAIAFEDGLVIVGREALKGSMIEPDAFADCFKRDIGRMTYHRDVNGYKVPPEVLSAFLLKRIKEDAEQRIGPIHEVVITVPAFFDEVRRKATQDAGRLAGLNVIDIINEPTAAAVAFGFHRMQNHLHPEEIPTKERLLVYDLGGGTFDVTILDVDGTTFRTIATDGDVQLGGRDFDHRLLDHIAEAFYDEHDIDPREDPHDLAQLWLTAQEVKHALTERRKTTAVCSCRGLRFKMEITRETFEMLTEDLLSRTETTTAMVVREAGLEWNAIDRVLAVGGSSRMPMIAGMLRRLTGMDPDRSQSADEAVAHGAALYAAMLMKERNENGENADPNKIKLVNVNSHSLGVVGLHPKTQQRVNVSLIPKNSPLPARKVKRFQTAKKNQTNVKVAVIEGESPQPEHCISLGECVVKDLPPGLPKGTPIEVDYQYATNGRLTISARVPSVRLSAHVQIERKGPDNLDDLNKWSHKLAATEEEVYEDCEGSSEVIPTVIDRVDVRKQIDELYVQIGFELTKEDVPGELRAKVEEVQAAANEMKEAEEALRNLQQLPNAPTSGPETGLYTGELARAKLVVQNAKTRLRFIRQTLGRETVESYAVPERLATLGVEISKLENQLELDDLEELEPEA
ncbi:MAG: Hsp70 family protein [Planctomycetia bacterium]|jgi:molecular chaperone DnaK